MIRIISLSLILLAYLSCSTRILVSTNPIDQSLQNEINDQANESNAKILLNNNQLILANNIRIGQDTLQFENVENSVDRSIPLDDIKEIKILDHFEGAIWGMTIGGLILGLEGYRQANGYSDSNKGEIFMLGGAFLGSVLGGMSGILYNYEFVNEIK